MSRLKMTKAALAERRQQLASYGRALPSLELKRQQLVVDLAAEKARAAALEADAASLRARAGAIPFAADADVHLEDLLAITAVERGQEARLGMQLPVLAGVEWRITRDLAAYPPWVEAALDVARDLAEVKLRLDVARQRVALVNQALRKAVQRINLLQQVLMPQAQRDILKISNFLADGQRMAIARTKLLVSRRARQAGAAAMGPQG